MRRFFRLAAAAVIPLGMTVVLMAAGPASAGNGNGAPPGPHFTLNIHGVANGQGFNGNNQNDIFTPLNGTCTINLSQAAAGTYGVINPDCVNNPPASFQLPAPCAIDSATSLCTTTTTDYSIYARALGKPGGTSNTTPCFTETVSNVTTQYCSTGSYMAVRGKGGKNSFSNVTSNLLFITQCISGKTQTNPIFANSLGQYYWTYDNQGLRLAQLRFYQVPTPVPTSGKNC
jgi:hypothetical protein